MHMKGHIRDLFLDTVERNDVRDMFLDDVVAVEEGHTGVVLTWGGLLGKLWTCTDCVPGDVCEELGFERGSSYASIAQRLKAVAGITSRSFGTG